MPTETLTKNEPAVSSLPRQEPEDELRERVHRRVERVRKAKESVALFVVGMAALVPIWLAVEWQSAGGFERWSDGDRPGDWDPWILWFAVPWFLWVVSVVLRAYFERDKEEEIERELARLQSHR